MKKSFIIMLLTICMYSCAEEYKSISPDQFNNSIALRTDIETPEQLIEIYYDYPVSERTPKLIIENKELDGDKIEVTLIHDNQEDDSIRATKIVIIAEKNDQTWRVLTINKNWRCYDGRGHTNWGTEYCN